MQMSNGIPRCLDRQGRDMEREAMNLLIEIRD